MNVIKFTSTTDLCAKFEEMEKEGYMFMMSRVHEESDNYPERVTSQLAAALCADGFAFYVDALDKGYVVRRKKQNEDGSWNFLMSQTFPEW